MCPSVAYEGRSPGALSDPRVSHGVSCCDLRAARRQAQHHVRGRRSTIQVRAKNGERLRPRADDLLEDLHGPEFEGLAVIGCSAQSTLLAESDDGVLAALQ